MSQSGPIDTHLCILSACGEFACPQTESQYRNAHLPEAIYLAQLCFASATLINLVFLWSDFRFYGEPHFFFALSARTAIIGISIFCWFMLRHTYTDKLLKRNCQFWAWITIASSAILLSPHTSIALFVAFILPAIFYLALPVSFFWSVVLGIAASATGLGAYLSHTSFSECTTYGLIADMLLCNTILLIVRVHSNRLSRQEWSATLAEHRMNSALAEEHETLHKLVRAIPLPLLITDRAGHQVLQANDAADVCFGPILKEKDFSLERCFSPEEWGKLRSKMETEHEFSQYETILQPPERSPQNILLAATEVAVAGTHALLTVFVDITKRKEMEAAIRHMARTDPLSGLPNRAFFFSVATAEIARSRRYHRPLAVFMADLDLFKQVNDTYGHNVGDEVLKSFAALSKNWIRRQDFVARMGGEEFAFLLPEATEMEAQVLAERLRSSVEAMRVRDLPLQITISIGISEVNPEETSVEAALSRADRALYAAKRMGRNCVMRYSRITRKSTLSPAQFAS